MIEHYYTWHESIQWLKEQPDQQEFIKNIYCDTPILTAAQRFAATEEWQAVRSFFPRAARALDIGAGQGISSYALAREGWQVTALDPDASPLVGTQAIRTLAHESALPIQIVQSYAETLPFADCTFELVYGRQVLHHAQDIAVFCQEVARVLKPGGRFIITREHVISSREDLAVFLATHPLHKLHGSENAFLLKEYIQSITATGLRIIKTLKPFSSVINYYPMCHEQMVMMYRTALCRRLGATIAQILTDEHHIVGTWMLKVLAEYFSRRSNTPGRMYSFIAEKPLICRVFS